MAHFRQRWNITSNGQLVVILIVFAVTGSTAAYISKPILSLFGINKDSVSPWLYYPLYILLIFPFYQVLLVAYGFLFGQFKFFWAFEKKMLRSMKLGFLLPDEQKKSRD
ncbi:MAG: diacylglyceryl transferase [Chitinophagaceae bacterium]|nr:MAG: diacylglyceryl transferase [Chitinophagaceae bacterium]